MANALKKITTRAKQIYAKGGTWKGAIKKAGAEYRSGKKTTKKRRRVGATLSSGSRPASYAIGRVKKRSTKKRRRVGATLSDSPRPAGYAIGRVSANHFIARAKESLGHQIAQAELRRFKATKKSLKNKAAKVIASLKSKYRKLC